MLSRIPIPSRTTLEIRLRLPPVSMKTQRGIVATVRACLADQSFGASFPLACPDGYGIAGADEQQFSLALRAEVPDISWPINPNELPDRLVGLDFVQFCHRHVAKPVQGDNHDFYRHYHLTFDRAAGQAAFRERINRVFARNGMAYELQDNGQIIRLAPEVLREALQMAVFRTGDNELDSLLESARIKFLSPDAKVRREGLEKLWDAWERIKTVESGADKKASVKALLDKVGREPHFRELLEREAKELTSIGNEFQIRHTETTQTPLQKDEHVDYLFHRLFGLIRMVTILRNVS
jgi:hypothetical protein